MHCCMKENFFAFSLQVKNNALKYILKHKFTMWQKTGKKMRSSELKINYISVPTRDFSF